MKRFPSIILSFLFMVSCKNNGPETEKSVVLRDYKLAMVQMTVVGGDQEQNLKVAAERIKEAAENGAKIAILPEALDFGWTHSAAIAGAGPIPGGKSYEILSKAAKENNIYVCAGIVERLRDRIYNSAVIIDRQGELVIRHRKLNELSFAHELYSLGSEQNVADTELGTLGLLICADVRAADFTLSKSLGLMGADIILSPSAWAVPKDHDNNKDPYGVSWIAAYKPICNIFNLWFIGVSNVGTVDDGEWKGWNCIGSSIAMDADGNKAIQGPYGVAADTILYINVHLKGRRARGAGRHERWRSGRD